MRRAGLTIMELLIAAALVSVVFLGSTVMFVSGYKAFRRMELKEKEINAFLAMEHMARRIGLGNEATIDLGGGQIKVRWDYSDYKTPLGSPPNGTPADFSDDTYLKYRFIGNRLRYRIDASFSGNVGASDPEVITGLDVHLSSSFVLDDPNRITVHLVALVGDPIQQKNLRTGILLQGRAQN